MAVTFAQAIRNIDRKARTVMYAELQSSMRGVMVSHKQVTMKWKNKPNYRLMYTRTQSNMRGMLVINGKALKIFRYVDEGTRPHFIRPRKAPFLSFRLGYRPMTKPIAKFNVGVGKAFGKRVRSLLVLHPGNDARLFNKTIATRLRQQFRNRLLRALARVK